MSLINLNENNSIRSDNEIIKGVVYKKSTSTIRNFSWKYNKRFAILFEDCRLCIYENNSDAILNPLNPKQVVRLNSCLIKQKTSDSMYPNAIKFILCDNGVQTEERITLDFVSQEFKKEWLEQIEQVKALNLEHSRKSQISNSERSNSNNNIGSGINQDLKRSSQSSLKKNSGLMSKKRFSQFNHNHVKKERPVSDMLFEISQKFDQQFNEDEQKFNNIVASNYIMSKSATDKLKQLIYKYNQVVNSPTTIVNQFISIKHMNLIEPHIIPTNYSGHINSLVTIHYKMCVKDKVFNGCRQVFKQVNTTDQKQNLKIMDIVKDVMQREITITLAAENRSLFVLKQIINRKQNEWFETTTDNIIVNSHKISQILAADLMEGMPQIYNEAFVNEFAYNQQYVSTLDMDNYDSESEAATEDFDLKSIKSLSLKNVRSMRGADQMNSDLEQVEKWEGDYFRDDHGQLYFLNQQTMAVQKDLFNLMLKRMGSNLVSGKSIMGITFPVCIFSTETLLKKQAKEYRMLPYLVEDLKTAQDPVHALGIFIAQQAANINLGMEQKKPFNPLWGETQVCKIGEQEVFSEQTLHHPPVSNLYISNADKSVQLQGHRAITVSIGMNNGRSTDLGSIYYQDTLRKYRICRWPNLCISNFFMGKRYSIVESYFCVLAPRDGLIAVLFFDPDNTNGSWFVGGIADRVVGQIVRSDEETNIEKHFREFDQNSFKNYQRDQIVGEIKGSWTGVMWLNYGDKTVQLVDVDIKTKQVQAVKEEGMPRLEADSQQRKDIAHWKMGSEAEADQVKTEQEDAQRHHRKIRQDHCQFRKTY